MELLIIRPPTTLADYKASLTLAINELIQIPLSDSEFSPLVLHYNKLYDTIARDVVVRH